MNQDQKSVLDDLSPSSSVCGLTEGISAIAAKSCEMKTPRIDAAVRELVTLSALAALGCALAAMQGDLLFAAVFGAASVVTTIEALRRVR